MWDHEVQADLQYVFLCKTVKKKICSVSTVTSPLHAGTCGHSRYKCNCDINDYEWRSDEGYLTDRTKLPVTQLMFGDTGAVNNPKVETAFHEQGFHTLGKLQCY